MVDGTGPVEMAHALVPAGQLKGDVAGISPIGQGAPQSEMPEPNIRSLRKMFDESRDLSSTARDQQQLDEDYYHGPEQLNSETRAILKARAQPPIFDNRIAPAIDGILGVIENGKTDPRAYPRNPDDEDSSQVATKALRYIADSTSFHQVKMDCCQDYHIHGLAASIIEYDGRDIKPVQIRWEEFFYDPRSRRKDFKDAKYLGIAKWMYADELKAMYPEQMAAMGDPVSGGVTALESTWDDRPDNAKPWVDKARNRLMVVEVYYRERGEWLRAVYIAAGWLEYDRSPYRDPRTGETICPIEAMSFKVDRENNRYGPIRNMRPMQDEVNARRSRGLHLLNSRQVQQTDTNAPTVDADTVRNEAARADGVIPMGWQAVSATDMASGNLQMLTEAKESLARMAPTPAVLNRSEGVSQSGRARLVVQQAGMTELARSFSQINDWETRCYKQMWMRAQQFKTDPWWIRVTDNVRSPEFLQINEPVMGMVLQPQQVGTDEVGQPIIQNIPAMGVVDYKNRIAELDLDIIIDSVPDTAALEQETFESLLELVRGGLDPFTPQFELLVELSTISDKARIIEKLKQTRDQMMQQQAQANAEAQQVAQANLMLDMQDKQAKTNKTNADTENTMAETQLKVKELFTPTGLQQ